MKINKKLIKELVDNLEEFKLTELEYSEKFLYFPVPTINIDLKFLLAIFKKSFTTLLQ